MKLIEVKNLTVRYRGTEAISDITFDIEEGDYVGIVGPNGSGKTTLIKALLGLVEVDGKVYFSGKKFSDFSRAKHIGYLPQKMSFLDQRFPATAKEIVLSGVYCCKKFPKRLTKKDYLAADEALELLDMAELEGCPIGKLSGGQQQRILLARALVHKPDMLILDEPTVTLDAQSHKVFYSTVQRLNRDDKVTILLITHDVGSIGNYASKLLYLDRKIIFYGTFEEFCKSSVMASYFGASQHLICRRHY